MRSANTRRIVTGKHYDEDYSRNSFEYSSPSKRSRWEISFERLERASENIASSYYEYCKDSRTDPKATHIEISPLSFPGSGLVLWTSATRDYRENAKIRI